MDISLIRRYWKKIVIMQIALMMAITCLAFLTVSVAAALNPSDKASVSADDTNATIVEAADFNPIGAGLAIGLAGLGAGIGMGTAGAAAIGAITEKPETFGRAIIFLVFIEAVAIYGLVIAILLLFG